MTTPSPRPPSEQASDGRRVARRALEVSAVAEPASLALLLLNLATVHHETVAALLGPLHGTAYLVAIAAAWTGDYPFRARCWTWVPGVGALVALRTAEPPPPEARPGPTRDLT